MREFKNTTIDEFQKCGEIVISVSRNKLAMTCNFCQEIFEQLQALMRHLRLEHSDELEFPNQTKEVDVYAVEELINLTAQSCAAGMDREFDIIEDGKQFSESDVKWLDKGIESKMGEECEDEVNLVNVPILEALEECDVFLNLMDGITCFQDKPDENTTYRDMHKDWDDGNDCNYNSNLKTDLNMKKLSISNTSISGIVSSNKENSDCIPMEERNDVNFFFGSLEGDSKRSNIQNGNNQINTNTIQYKKNQDVASSNDFTKNNHFKIEGLSNNCKVLQNAKLSENYFANSNKFIINSKCRKILKNSCVILNKPNEFGINSTFEHDLVKNTNDNRNFIINNNMDYCLDLEKQLTYENEFLQESQENPTCNDTPLSEDLTKVLSDALDDDLDLLNINLEGDVIEQLNEEILELLERELAEKDNEEVSKKHAPVSKINLKECKLSTTLRKQIGKPILNKTRAIKDRAKISKIKAEKLLEPLKSPLKQSNHAKIITKKKTTLSKTPLQNKSIANISNIKKFNNLHSIKLSDKINRENNVNNLNSRIIKVEQITPSTNPIKLRSDKENIENNMDNSKIRKIKVEHFSPPICTQTGENPEFLVNEVTKLLAITPQKELIKESGRHQHKPVSVSDPKIQQFKKELKQVKQQHQTDIIPQKNQNYKSLCKSLRNSQSYLNKKIPLPTKTIINDIAKSTLTIPQRLTNVSTKLPRTMPDIHILNNTFKKDVANSIAQEFKYPIDIKNITQCEIVKTSSESKFKTNILVQNNEIKSQLQLQSNCANVQQCTKFKKSRKSNLDQKSCALKQSCKKKKVLQHVRNIKQQIFKAIETSEYVTKVINNKSPTNTGKKDKCFIKNITTLPNIDSKLLNSLVCQKPDRPTTTQSLNKNLTDREESYLSHKPNSKKAIKRRAPESLPIKNEAAKRQEKCLAGEQNEKMEVAKFSSNVGFLQRDLKNEDFEQFNHNKAKAETVEMRNALLKEVKNHPPKLNEKTPEGISNENKKEILNENLIEDFNFCEDMNLLSKVGLQIIKLPEIEVSLCLEESEHMYNKASKFANIYKNFPRLWTTKNIECHIINEELNINFKHLLADTNHSYNLNLSTAEIKRLVNLIHFWYAHCCKKKLMKKQKISESVNKFLKIFNFLPKTIRRFYYCEYCKEHFTTDNKYHIHRESSCNSVTNREPLVKKNSPHNRIKATVLCKCIICADTFATPKLLYEHSKSHLKTIYNCDKCALVFASDFDAQKHMHFCNTGLKHTPKKRLLRSAKNNKP